MKLAGLATAYHPTEYKTGMVPICCGCGRDGKFYVITDDGSLWVFGEKESGKSIPLSVFRWKKEEG